MIHDSKSLHLGPASHFSFCLEWAVSAPFLLSFFLLTGCPSTHKRFGGAAGGWCCCAHTDHTEHKLSVTLYKDKKKVSHTVRSSVILFCGDYLHICLPQLKCCTRDFRHLSADSEEYFPRLITCSTQEKKVSFMHIFSGNTNLVKTAVRLEPHDDHSLTVNTQNQYQSCSHIRTAGHK